MGKSPEGNKPYSKGEETMAYKAGMEALDHMLQW